MNWLSRRTLFTVPYPAKLTPAQITHAATEIVAQHGAAHLSMRTLAERLGVRASSLYRHFDNRDTLLRTIGDQAALNLRDALAHAAKDPDPATALPKKRLWSYPPRTMECPKRKPATENSSGIGILAGSAGVLSARNSA